MSGGGSGGGFSGLGNFNLNSLFGGYGGRAPQSPFNGAGTDPNAPWSGMTFQQSMGLYPRGTFQGQGPTPGTAPGAPAGWGQAALPGVAGGLASGAMPTGQVLHDPLGAMMTFASGPQATSYGGPNMGGLPNAPYAAPNSYANFAGLASGSGTLQPTPPVPSGTPTPGDISNLPAGSQ